MRRHAFTVLAVLAALLMVSIGTASAETFIAPRGSEVSVGVAGETATVHTNIPDVVEVHQYRYDNSDKKGWILPHKVVNGSASFAVYTGDRFQLVNKSGRFLFLSPELAVANYPNVRFYGCEIECSNPEGCALQVSR